MRAGVGDGDSSPLGDHWDLSRRFRESRHHQAHHSRPHLPPAIRRHWPRRMHLAGEVRGSGDSGDGAVLCGDDTGGDRGGDRDLESVQGGQQGGAHRGRSAPVGVGGDTDIHGAGGPDRGRLHEPPDARQPQAPGRC